MPDAIVSKSKAVLYLPQCASLTHPKGVADHVMLMKGGLSAARMPGRSECRGDTFQSVACHAERSSALSNRLAARSSAGPATDTSNTASAWLPDWSPHGRCDRNPRPRE